MNNQDNRLYEMCLRVQQSHKVLAGKIPANSYAGELFERLTQSLGQLAAHNSAQSSSTRAVTESGTGKRASRKTLRERLAAIRRTARPLEKTTPGVAGKFRIPRRPKDQDLLSFARAVAVEVIPFKDEFIKRGLPANFPEELSAATAAFEQAIGRKIHNKESRVASNATVKRVLGECADIVRDLDPVVRNLFADDVAALAIWESASHVERASRRARPAAQPAPPPPGPAN